MDVQDRLGEGEIQEELSNTGSRANAGNIMFVLKLHTKFTWRLLSDCSDFLVQIFVVPVHQPPLGRRNSNSDYCWRSRPAVPLPSNEHTPCHCVVYSFF